MPLTIIEMNYIQQGIVRPLENSLKDLNDTMAMKHSQYLLNTEKDVDGQSAAAVSCLAKQRAAISNIMSKNSNTLGDLLTRMILQMGNLTNFAAVRGYSITDWSTFLESNMPAVFDSVAGISTDERNAYNAVV